MYHSLGREFALQTNKIRRLRSALGVLDQSPIVLQSDSLLTIPVLVVNSQRPGAHRALPRSA